MGVITVSFIMTFHYFREHKLLNPHLTHAGLYLTRNNVICFSIYDLNWSLFRKHVFFYFLHSR